MTSAVDVARTQPCPYCRARKRCVHRHPKERRSDHGQSARAWADRIITTALVLAVCGGVASIVTVWRNCT